jgi:hypothetical protein
MSEVRYRNLRLDNQVRAKSRKSASVNVNIVASG